MIQQEELERELKRELKREKEVELENQNEIQTPEFMPRNVAVVALQILQIIPQDKNDFYNDIDRLIKTDLVYKDDYELRSHYNWIKLQVIMHKHVPIVDEKWKESLVDVFIGK